MSFDIARDGTISNIEVKQGSGIPSLDRSIGVRSEFEPPAAASADYRGAASALVFISVFTMKKLSIGILLFALLDSALSQQIRTGTSDGIIGVKIVVPEPAAGCERCQSNGANGCLQHRWIIPDPSPWSAAVCIPSESSAHPRTSNPPIGLLLQLTRSSSLSAVFKREMAGCRLRRAFGI
jgi:hypothetical protein